jgi:EAL domain-containing protein (putative c-di-GMP-specific phosphodiesterase class I)
VLRKSVAQMKDWDLQAPQSRLVVNVNVSTRQLERPGLLAVIDELISEGLDPTRLVLEITETALTVDGDAAAETLRQLRARGLRLAVDDFGTGYSSLSRLQASPVSQLKIDRSFVNEIESATSLVPIVHATVAMAAGLGLGVIAEGVETPAQLQYLRRLGCAYAQGYLLSRPQDADAISELLTGELPWTALIVATTDAPDRRLSQSRRLSDTFHEAHIGSEELYASGEDLRPSDVVQAAQAIAALAAAEVAADAAVAAQAAVAAACTAALMAAEKAERVAAQAAAAAAAAARALAAADHTPQPQHRCEPTDATSEQLRGDRYTAEAAARDVVASRAAEAAASAALKVAAQVESVAAAAAAAGANAAGLIQRRLAEDAAEAATTVAATTPHSAATDGQHRGILLPPG